MPTLKIWRTSLTLQSRMWNYILIHLWGLKMGLVFHFTEPVSSWLPTAPADSQEGLASWPCTRYFRSSVWEKLDFYLSDLSPCPIAFIFPKGHQQFSPPTTSARGKPGSSSFSGSARPCRTYPSELDSAYQLQLGRSQNYDQCYVTQIHGFVSDTVLISFTNTS